MLENVIYECATVWMQLHITMFESKVNLKFLHFDGLIRSFFSSGFQRSCVYRYLSFPKRFNSIRFISNIHNLYIHGECVCVHVHVVCSILRSGQYCPISIRLSKIECNLLVLIFRAIVLLLFPCPFISRLFIAQRNICSMRTRQGRNLQQKYVVMLFSKKNHFFSTEGISWHSSRGNFMLK